MSGKDVTLYDPTAEPRILAAGRAPRPADLRGKKIAILDNSKANAGILMLAVAKRLQERYGAGEIVKREKGIAGALVAHHPRRAHEVRRRPRRQRRLRVVHVVEYPRRHRAGAEGDPVRRHGHRRVRAAREAGGEEPRHG